MIGRVEGMKTTALYIESYIVKQYKTRYACAMAAVKAAIDDRKIVIKPLDKDQDMDGIMAQMAVVRCQVQLDRSTELLFKQKAYGSSLSETARDVFIYPPRTGREEEAG